MSAMERLSSRTVAFISALGISLLTAIGPASSASAQEPTWSPIVDIATLDVSQYDPQPQLVVTDDGRTVAVWAGYEAAGYSIQTKWSDDAGLTWSSVYNISDWGVYATPPRMSIDSSGRIIAVWTLSYGTENYVQANWSSDGGKTWSMSVNLSDGVGYISEVQIAIDSAGNALAAWVEDDGPGWTVKSSRSLDGGATWSASNDVGTGGGASSPRIAFDASDNAILVWSQYVGITDNVLVSSSTDLGATWTAPSALSPAGQAAYGQDIGVDSTGQAIVIWYRYDGADFDIQSSWSDDGGVNWSTPQDMSNATGGSPGPLVEFVSVDHAIAAWTSDEGSDATVQARWSNDGGATWQTPIDVATAPGDIYGLRFAIDSSGNMMLVWYRNDGGPINFVEYSSSVDGGLTWSTPSVLSPSSLSVGYISVSVDSRDNVTLVWSGYDGLNYLVQSRTVSSPSDPTLPNTGMSDDTAIIATIMGLLGIGLGAVVLIGRSRRRSS